MPFFGLATIRARAGITGSSLNTMPTEADPYLMAFYNNKFTDPVLLKVLRERAIESGTRDGINNI